MERLSSADRHREPDRKKAAIPETLTDSILLEGTIDRCRMIYTGSNGVFLVSVQHNGREVQAIYKPRSGESPLWDFPDGTLYLRERAAFVVSEELGWSIVPPTVLKTGPYGVGVLQRYVTPRTESYYEIRNEHRQELKKIAVFDLIVNNADRKAGHCLLDDSGHVWGIDHGLTFHPEPKLRTVIWDFGGDPIPGEFVRDMTILLRKLNKSNSLMKMLTKLLDEEEIEALRRRLQRVINHPFFPVWTGSYRSIPWPPY